MLINTISLTANSHVPWYTFPSNQHGGNCGLIHFSPANGIPVASYAGFLSCFSERFQVSGMDNRGAWPNQALPHRHFNWQNHADDLIEAIETRYQQPVIGMGHSIGGTVTALAALKRPDLFTKLVLIDAASTPSKFISMMTANSPQWLAFKLFKFIKRTHHRRKIWPSRQAFVANYQHHPTYRLFTEQAFADYAQHGLLERDDGQFELAFNPHWESFNFRKVHFLWDALNKTTHPTLLLRAEHSYMYSQTRFEELNRNLPDNINAHTITGAHHLVSHEMPDALATQIQAWI